MLKTLYCQVLLFHSFLFTLKLERIHFLLFAPRLSHLISMEKKPSSITSLQHLSQLQFTLFSCSCDRFMSHRAAYINQVVITFCSIYPPSDRLSHLVNPKGETCRCTTASLNPLQALFTVPLPPRALLLLGLYKQPLSPAPPLPVEAQRQHLPVRSGDLQRAMLL